jgi:TonB family protein
MGEGEAAGAGSLAHPDRPAKTARLPSASRREHRTQAKEATMLSSAQRTQGHCEIPVAVSEACDGPPALEVRAAYHGVLLGTRFLAAGEPRRRWPTPVGSRAHTRYIIGESPAADAPAPIEVLGEPDLPLVTKWSGGFLVQVTPGMSGDVATGGKVYRLADYLSGRGHTFILPADGRARIDCGAMRFELAPTARPTALPRGWFAWRWNEHKFTLGSFLTLALFLLMIFAIPPETNSISTDYYHTARAGLPATITAPQPATPPVAAQPAAEPSQGKEGKALLGKSGIMGNPNAKQTSGGYAVKKTGEPPHLGKAEAEAQARNAGILGILGRTAGSRFTSLFGYDTAAGDAENDVLGNLIAANIGDGYGNGGWGVTGTGNYGGGTGQHTLGVGNFNTLGSWGPGRGPDTRLASRQPKKVRDVIPGTLTFRGGSLDKEIIRRVVRLHMNEVKYCYDQELVRNRGVEGRVSVQFIISGTGQVITSFVQSTSMNNPRVESCVAAAVKRWTFPKPEKGGLAIVSYPFNFVAGQGG